MVMKKQPNLDKNMQTLHWLQLHTYYRDIFACIACSSVIGGGEFQSTNCDIFKTLILWKVP